MNCTIECIFAQHLIWDHGKRHIFCGRWTSKSMTTDDPCPFFDELEDNINKKVLGIEFLGDRSKPRKEV